MNLIFKVSPKSENSLIDISQKINTAPCKIYFDFSNAIIYAVDVESIFAEDVIDFVSKYYFIEDTKLDNTIEEKENCEVNRLYKPFVNRLIKTVNEVSKSEGIEELDIKNFLRSCNDELLMKVSETPYLDITEGQLVECHLGQNLPGEISGAKVPCVIYEIKSKMVRVIPIIRKTNILNGYLKADEQDFNYISSNIDLGYFAICKSLFIRRERVKSIIGSVKEEKLNFLKSEISKFYSFNDVALINNEKTALYELIEDKVHNKNVKEFLVSIGMDPCKEIVGAFECAKKLNKITYENILCEMYKKSEFKDKKDLKAIIKHKFDLWLMNYPELKKRFTKISLTSLIKIYVEENTK